MGGPVARARGRNAIVDPELDFRPVPAGTGDGAALVAAMIDEMRELYWDVGDGLDLNSPDMPKGGPAELSPPAGVFLVGYRDGAAVCGGGVKRLPDGGCEIKRMVRGARRPRAGARPGAAARAGGCRPGVSAIRWRDWTPGRVNRTPRGCTSPRATSRWRTSTATRWRRSSGRSASRLLLLRRQRRRHPVGRNCATRRSGWCIQVRGAARQRAVRPHGSAAGDHTDTDS
ncbi:MAG: hypothetical protein QOF25_1729 [Mycobacterium sp.]|nr:hypothetical protein [Mycobacterium sp.]